MDSARKLGAPRGFRTFRLYLCQTDPWTTETLHQLFGDKHHPLVLPAAFQTSGFFGSNVGSVHSSLVAVSPSAAFDSWLTLGDEEYPHWKAIKLATESSRFANWTVKNGIQIRNSALSTMFSGQVNQPQLPTHFHI